MHTPVTGSDAPSEAGSRGPLTADAVQQRLRYIVEKDRLVLDDLPRRFLEAFAAILRHTNYRQTIDNYARITARCTNCATACQIYQQTASARTTCPATARICCSRSTAGISARVASCGPASSGASILDNDRILEMASLLLRLHGVPAVHARMPARAGPRARHASRDGTCCPRWAWCRARSSSRSASSSKGRRGTPRRSRCRPSSIRSSSWPMKSRTKKAARSASPSTRRTASSFSSPRSAITSWKPRRSWGSRSRCTPVATRTTGPSAAITSTGSTTACSTATGSSSGRSRKNSARRRACVRAKILIGECGHASRSAKAFARTFGGQTAPPVVHILEYTLPRVQGRPAAARSPGAITDRVTYHDPCNIGRSKWIIDEPREILRAFCSDFVEMTPRRLRQPVLRRRRRYGLVRRAAPLPDDGGRREESGTVEGDRRQHRRGAVRELQEAAARAVRGPGAGDAGGRSPRPDLPRDRSGMNHA